MKKAHAKFYGSLLAVTLVVGTLGCAARQGVSTVGGSTAGMDPSGEVTDSSLVEAGSGRTVQGIDDWEGEVTGKSFPGAKFDQLKMGMTVGQVTELLGEPNEVTSYITGKAFIPFNYGSDRSRFEMVYANQGRLVFSHQGGFSGTMHLIWIIYDKDQPGKL